jgi:histidinol-phosphate aminotransferase
MTSVMELAGERLDALRDYAAGQSSPRPAGKLSSNESPFGASPRVRTAIARSAAHAHRYGSSEELRERIAEVCGVSADQVVVTNGSDELCYLIATLFLTAGARVVLSDPCYQIDELVTRLHLGVPVFVPLRSGAHDLEAMAAAAADAALLWLPSPHNPTGLAVAPAALGSFLAAVPPACLVVLDEAYRPYTDPELRPDVAALLEQHPNLVVQRTLSKADGLAGLRIGYGIGTPEAIRALNRIRPPFNINQAALAAALVTLSERAWPEYVVELVRRERTRFEGTLATLGVDYYPSQANFTTFRPTRPHQFHEALADQGLVVRDGADLGIEGWVRATIGAPPQMALLRGVLTNHEGAV